MNQANKGSSIARMVDYVSSEIPGLPEEVIKNKIKVFSAVLTKKWSAIRNKEKFVLKCNDWLQEELWLAQNQDAGQPDCTPARSAVTQKMDFVGLSASAKKKRTRMLVAGHSPEELAYATQTSFTKIGKRNMATVIKTVTVSSPKSLRTIKRRKVTPRFIRPYTPDEALALITNSKLSVDQYKQIRRGAKERGCDIYPSYDRVLTARKECYPNDIMITETKGEVKLQSLLDHTAQRLVKVQLDVIAGVVIDDGNSKLYLKSKWGFDGSSSQSEYKQRFIEDAAASDADILLTSLVPLQLVMKREENETILWQNPRSSSTRFCRPIRYQMLKESHMVLKDEDDYINRQIAALNPTQIEIGDRTVNIEHILLETMLDGKAANALSDNKSSQTCNICKATPNHMNDIDAVIQRPCNKDLYVYGLSTLHAHIRLFECVLHISYRKEHKTWRVTKNIKEAVDEKKRAIIEEYRCRTGLLVDTVKQGSGSTNDGNTARTFFEDPALAAEITGVDKDLISRFSVILKALSCSYDVNPKAYKEYSLETARLFVTKYQWYKMPSSVHKILIHGADVIGSLVLPIGQLSEEALESRHKDCRYYREHSTRKIGRKQTIEDLLHALLISSDPLISSIRPLPQRKSGTLAPEVLKLLKAPEAPERTHSSDEEADSE